MADEAVLRIVLEGDGGGGGSSSSPTSTSPPPSTPPPSTSGSSSGAPPAPRKPKPPFDPFDAARAEREKRDQEVAKDAAYQQLFPSDPSGALNKKAESERKRIETQQRRDEKKVQAENRKIERERDRAISKIENERDRNIAKINRDQERRRKRIEKEIQRANKQQNAERKRIERESDRGAGKVLDDAERQRNKGEIEKRKRMRERLRDRKNERLRVQREEAKLERANKKQEPRPPFDPTEMAKKRRESERRSAQVEDAYKKEYGDEEQHKGPLDLIFARISTLRGTLGGLFGTTVGATLDVFHILRREQAEYQRKEKRKALLREADDIEAEKYGEAAEKYRGDPSASTRAGGKVGLVDFAKAGVGIAGKMSKSKGPSIPDAPSLGSAIDTGKIDKKEDPYATVTGVAGAMAKFGGAIPVIGAAVVAIGAAVSIVSSLMNSINRMADNYAQYNPEIAQAQSLVEIRKTLNDMRRAQESGGELAKFIEAQGRMEQRWEEIKLKLLMVIIPTLTNILEVVGRMLKIREDELFDIKDPAEIVLNDPTLTAMGIGATTELNRANDTIGGLRGF